MAFFCVSDKPLLLILLGTYFVFLGRVIIILFLGLKQQAGILLFETLIRFSVSSKVQNAHSVTRLSPIAKSMQNVLSFVPVKVNIIVAGHEPSQNNQ